MRFSVIIPSFNRAHILGSTLRSVISQSHRELEIIVVDDGSTDNTREVVENLKDSRLRYYHKANAERSVARNFGAERSTGEYLIFLDSDDRMRPDHLARLNQYISDNNFKPKFIFSGFRIIATDGRTISEYKRSGIFDGKTLVYGNHLGCSAVTIERGLFRLYKFNEHPDIILFEDWELWLRVLSHEDLHCIPAATIEMVDHAGRSVLNCEPGQLVRKVKYFLRAASKSIPLVSGSLAKRRLAMGLYSYVALHIALQKHHRRQAWFYLVKAFSMDPTLVTRRRFYATLKHLL